MGSGAPLDSYLIKVDDVAPLDWRTIVPTTTFEIDPSTGAISGEFVPAEIEFTEKVNGVVKIRKVARSSSCGRSPTTINSFRSRSTSSLRTARPRAT